MDSLCTQGTWSSRTCAHSMRRYHWRTWRIWFNHTQMTDWGMWFGWQHTFLTNPVHDSYPWQLGRCRTCLIKLHEHSVECDVIMQHGRHRALFDVMNEAIVWSPRERNRCQLLSDKHHCKYERFLRSEVLEFGETTWYHACGKLEN